jgi:uncharacterized protein (TIGR03067 family)
MNMPLKKSLGFTALSLRLPCVLLFMQAGCTTHPSTAAAPQRLHGTWEGAAVGAESYKCTLTITGHSLRFQRTDQFYEATFTLPPETNPQQLRATITAFTNSSGAMAIGEVISSIYKIEDGTLTLAGEPHEGLKAFEDPTTFHFKFRKVQRQKTNAEASTSK